MNIKKILTVPNILSFFRLLLIPLLVWLYRSRQNDLLTMLVLLLSGATDILDGIIARKYRMVSNLGKALDPIADKLTQLAMLFCLVGRFPHMGLPLCVLALKELCAGVLSLLAIQKSKTVYSAVWHGKLSTFLLYAVMALHLVWYSIPVPVSDGLILLCTAAMLLSAVLYTRRNLGFLKKAR